MVVVFLLASLAVGDTSVAAPWSFAPIAAPALPDVARADWPHGAVDRFVLARLEAAGLEPAPGASRADLVRRLSYDLRGLPPSPGELASFTTDDAPDAWERLVDRFLADPRLGERQGQHWLDVVRYAETEGFEYDRTLPSMWRYRDWVIAALNEDKPFDRFVTEQVAGDELAGDLETIERTGALDPGRERLLAAAGLHRLGPVRRNAGNQEVASSRNEVLTERTDIIGSAFLGLSMGCARCHDHKFDPISQEDYYSLQAFLGATREHNAPLVRPENAAEYARWKKTTDELEAKLAELKAAIPNATDEEEKRIRERLAALKKRLPPPFPSISTIRNDPARRTEVRLLERGDWEKKGRPVAMRTPPALARHDTVNLAVSLPASAERPRTHLARWLVSRKNPLTARVIANRIWQQHFGIGLVKTANDFGVNGEAPSHPELLDWLATELIESGWSLKALHRTILLSSAYRQTSRREIPARSRQVDPENRLLWRFNRRRLDAEEIRDSMLAVSRRINLAMGGESVVLPVSKELVDLLYDTGQWKVTEDVHERDRRSVYLFAKRNLRLPFMEVFDQPALQTSCARREASTHAPQSLELLNGEISHELAAAFAARLRAEMEFSGGESLSAERRAAIVRRAYELAVGREPLGAEIEIAGEFLQPEFGERGLEELALAIFNLTSFLYVP